MPRTWACGVWLAVATERCSLAFALGVPIVQAYRHHRVHDSDTCPHLERAKHAGDAYCMSLGKPAREACQGLLSPPGLIAMLDARALPGLPPRPVCPPAFLPRHARRRRGRSSSRLSPAKRALVRPAAVCCRTRCRLPPDDRGVLEVRLRLLPQASQPREHGGRPSADRPAACPRGPLPHPSKHL